MPLPGMRGGGEPPNPPPLSAAARALREAETSGSFEQRMIFLANAAAVFLVVVVLLCTLLNALPDKESSSSRRKKAKAAAAAAALAAKDGKYTAADVAKHASPDDLWIIIKGKVYDVTSYVEEHPGGASILKNAGKDSTAGFHGPQHPTRVFDIIDDFLIGTLVESDKDK